MASNCHIQRNLSALKDLPRVASFNIKDLPGAKKAVGIASELRLDKHQVLYT